MLKKFSLSLGLIAGIAILGAIVPQWLRITHPQNPPPITPVAVAKVTRTDLEQTAEFDAEFRPYQEIDLHAKVAGFVKEMLVDIGDRVQAGQLLATLEVPELQDDIAHAQAVEKRCEDDIQRAQAAYEEAHLSYTRIVGVEKTLPNLVAQQDLDIARTKDQAAEAALAETKHTVQMAKADIDKLNDMLAYTRITAPFAGVITKREADTGALISGGASNSQTMPLLRLSQNDRLRLRFPVSVSHVAQIKLGQLVQIHIQATGQSLPGSVSRFTRKVDTATRTMDVEVDVPNPNLSLVPGMYASVTVSLERHNNTLAIPIGAVSRRETNTVYVLDKQNKIQEQKVTLGLETPTLVEITSGLTAGELVLVGSHSQIEPGQKVNPKIINLAAIE